MIYFRPQVKFMSPGPDTHFLVTGRNGAPAHEQDGGLLAPEGNDRREALSEAGSSVASRRMTVLLADESPGEHRLIRALLDELGMPVELHWADSGDKAITHFDDGRACPDILLIDPVLPGVDGWEVIGTLRATCKANGVKIAVLAPQPSDYILRRCAELGVDAILEKPITPQAMIRLLSLRTAN